MLSRHTVMLLLVAVVSATSLPAFAVVGDDAGVAMPARTVGVGLQGSPFPIFGLAATYNLNQSLAVQAVGRAGFTEDFWLLRALYRFKNEPGYNIYADAFFGMFSDEHVYENPLDDYETDTATTFGFGAGYEHFFPSMPRFGWNVEVDYVHIGFEEKWFKYDYETFNLVMIGVGVQYYF